MTAATASAETVARSTTPDNDSLRDSLAANGNPIAALILPKDDPRRTRRKTAYAARETAETCGRCGHALHPDEPVWLQRCGRRLTGVCWRCQNEGAAYWPERPCGHCQRPVYAVSWAARASTVVFCSKTCRSEGRTAVIRQCATCGNDFAPKRNDAVTCSSKCRQKAYRQRGVTDNRRRTARPPNNCNGNLGIPA